MILNPKTIKEAASLGRSAIAAETNADGMLRLHMAHIDAGVLKWSTSSNVTSTPISWQVQDTIAAEAIYCTIEFNGYWYKQSEGKIRFMTTGQPLILWVDSLNKLYAKWMDGGVVFQLAQDVIKVDSVRGWRSIENRGEDQGIVIVYIKTDGTVWYQSYTEQPDGSFMWEAETQIIEIPAPCSYIHVFRANDYRLGVIAENLNNIHWFLTKRNWSGMSIGAERITVNTTLTVELKKINFYNTYNTENITVDLIMHPAKLLYTLADNRFKNIINENSYTIKATTQNGMTEVTAADFKVTDSADVEYSIISIEKNDEYLYTLITTDFNNAVGDMTVSFLGSGTTLGAIGQIMNPFSKSFEPTGLIPSNIPPPAIQLIYNVGDNYDL